MEWPPVVRESSGTTVSAGPRAARSQSGAGRKKRIGTRIQAYARVGGGYRPHAFVPAREQDARLAVAQRDGAPVRTPINDVRPAPRTQHRVVEEQHHRERARNHGAREAGPVHRAEGGGDRRRGQERRRVVRADAAGLVVPRLHEDDLCQKRQAEQQRSSGGERCERERREQQEDHRDLSAGIVHEQRVVGIVRVRAGDAFEAPERRRGRQRESNQRQSDTPVPPERARRRKPEYEEDFILFEPQQQRAAEQ